eukprot:CAMPEP_0175927524 /NCGR_PEP_ID=MMETSP0108-20121206/16768_1 /TAXON_ID=195067 ORGANISM="Goniomonas pacifica, Strain CCMP1869" /NCGR_SAMPLE_ID=MMETSP0108 /ASSEMBLY_ACC=CAM_ASM_000204 /LENGTH=84 /DNA_ID=CAMNT_0017250833 /DNA_START=319 /DNA_END=573 /DNA_ORIENTATION=-
MNSRNLACGSAVLALIEAEPRVSVADRGAEWLPVGNSVRLSEEDSGNYDIVHGRGARTEKPVMQWATEVEMQVFCHVRSVLAAS